MSTKSGLTALLVGGYLIAFAIAGLNATSGGTEAVYAVVLVVAFVITGWSMVLPWNGAKTHAATGADQGSPASTPRS
jgi:hypothetical protein